MRETNFAPLEKWVQAVLGGLVRETIQPDLPERQPAALLMFLSMVANLL